MGRVTYWLGEKQAIFSNLIKKIVITPKLTREREWTFDLFDGGSEQESTCFGGVKHLLQDFNLVFVLVTVQIDINSS